MNENLSRAHWSSRLGFILATTGAAVGLGNVWKFPYMVGANGGSAFVLVYLLCVFVVGIPVMLAEMMIGRRGGHNAVTTMGLLAQQAKRSARWQFLGWWGAATLLLVLSFYSVVASWSLAYVFKAFGGAFTGRSASEIAGLWQSFLADPRYLMLWNTVFMFLTLWVVAKGVQGGLEKASKIMMPGLFIVLIVLVGFAASTGGFGQAAEFLFSFDLEKLSPSVVISAMGHAFFTLAVGAGAMLVYGSYLPKNVRLGSAVMTVALLDVFIALLAGFAIFPIVFANGLSPQGGPGLMFITLPVAFAQMEGGQIVGGLFFVLLFFAAWTSSISLAEPIVDLLQERYFKSRPKSAVTVGVFALVLSVGSMLSFNLWQDVKFFGKWNIFEMITDLSTNVMLPIGGLFFALFAGFIMRKEATKAELSFAKDWQYLLWRIAIRYIAPVAIIIILFNGLWVALK